MSEFQEIAHAGGKIEITTLPDGRRSIRYTHSRSTKLVYQQVCVSNDGKLLDIVSYTGMGPMPAYPQPSILAHLLSDQNGMFGKKCPSCDSYFRTDYTGRIIHCPYCGEKSSTLDFVTQNQYDFIISYCQQYANAQKTDSDITIDYDEIARTLHENETSPWVYTEEQQQSQSKCRSCNAIADILGDYGICPQCGLHNSKKIFNDKMDVFEQRFLAAYDELTDRHQREEEWEKLLRCVSEFESMANELNKFLVRIPMAPQRRQSLERLSYQRISNADRSLTEWFGFGIFTGVSEVDQDFLNKMFNRRHLFTHKGGRVDQEYIDNTGDTSVRLNQTITLRSKEIKRLITLVKQIGNNLIDGFESIN